MILTAKGIGVPRVMVPTRPAPVPETPPAAPPARSLAPVLRTQAQVKGTGQLLPKPTGPKPLTSAATAATKPALPEPTRAVPSAPARSEAAAVANAVAKEAAKSDSPRKAVPGTKPETTNRLNSLNAAIASLGRSLHNTSSAVANGKPAQAPATK